MSKGIVILGAGASGLSAGYFIGKDDSVIYEAQESCGGLCNNIKIGDFIFDKAVHLSFTNMSEVRRIFDKTEYFTHKPEAYNFYEGNWIKHPVQNNLNALPIKERIECIKSFISRPEITENISNYEEWLYQQYGEEMSEKFPKKYTRKYWCDEAKKLETKWIGNRMYRPSIDDVLYGAMCSNTENVYYAKEMRYPVKGGFRSFLTPMINNVDIRLNKKAVCIDTAGKYVEFADGEKRYYDKLVSSMPLPEIIKIIKDVPQNIKEASKKLISTSMRLVSVGFNKPDVAKHLWWYIYDEDIYPARVYSPNLKSINNVPKGCSALQFEIYESRNKKIDLSDDSLCEHVEKCIKKMNLADKKDIIFMKVNYEKYANVVFYNDTYKSRKIIREYLLNNGINTVGRFGEWDYFWSDQSIISVKHLGLGR